MAERSGKTASFYLSARSEEVLATRDRHSRSDALDKIVDRYGELCRRAVPEFSVDEWGLLIDALKGTMHEPAEMIAVAGAGIVDAIALDGLATKWGVSAESLRAKLGALSYAQSLALVDYAERYWTAVSRGEGPKVPGEA